MPADLLRRALDERLLSPLAALRRRARLYQALDGGVRLLLALIMASLLQLTLDRWLRFSLDQRAVLNFVITLVWLGVIYRFLVRPLARPLPDVQLAIALDRAHPHLHDQLATAVRFAEGRVGDPAANSPALVQAVLRDTCRDASGVSFMSVLNHRRAARRAGEFAGLLIIVLGAFTLPLISDLVRVWFHRNWLLAELPWPQRTNIVPIGYEVGDRRRVPLNEELEVVANVYGEMPTSAVLLWESAGGQRGREPMTRVGDIRLQATLGVITGDVRFRIVGGDERTREFTAVAVERPRILRTRTTIEPPEYAGLPPMNIEQETVFETLNGSRIEIEAWLNKPVSSAHFAGADSLVAACERLAPDHIRVRLRAAAEPAGGAAPATQPASAAVDGAAALPRLLSGTYHFDLQDTDRWSDRRPLRFTIKVTPDGPPAVRLELIGVGESVTPQAELNGRLRFEDAYGLRAVALQSQKSEQPPRRDEFAEFVPGVREFDAQAFLAIESLGAQPGERVRIWGEALDSDPRGPNTGRSAAIELRVLSREDFLIEISQRELELRREFERLISEQRVLGDSLQRLLPTSPAETPPTGQAQRLAALARQQNTHARRCETIAAHFGQLLAEMRTSNVARAVDERRIVDQVARPLSELSADIMPAAANQILGARNGVDAERRSGLLAQQAEILQRMRAVLSQMLEWEGYQEAVTLLREIIDEQGRVRTDTQSEVARQLQVILGLEQPDATPEPPKP
jgi:hypothetical protein